jgi:hypothetical protein
MTQEPGAQENCDNVAEIVTGDSAQTSDPTADKNAAALADTEGEDIEVRPSTW